MNTRDILYDSLSGKIYASIPSGAGVGGNSVVSISVPQGELGRPLFVGSEPNKLAISDDGQYLYVGLDGAAAIRRVDLASQTAEIQFALGTDFCGAFRAEDIVVLKGDAKAVAVSRRNPGCSPRHEGVAIYDDGVSRFMATPGHTGSNALEPSDSGSVLYGANNETTEFGFRVMSVLPSGVAVTSTTPGLISGFGTDIVFDSGLLYASNGVVVDPVGLSLVGTYAGAGPVCPDSTTGRVYFLGTGSNGVSQLQIFDQTTFTPIASLDLPGVSGTPSRLLKVGQNVLAFRTASQVFILRLIHVRKGKA